MSDIKNLFANNKAWAEGILKRDPEFFSKLSGIQAPKFLWIGCSDSRVPANEITGLLPGELFVHRNVANVVVPADLNCLSVIQYAVEVLKVEHIIVCGHYQCGGVKAAMDDVRLGLIDNWLRHIQDVMHKHAVTLGAADAAERFDLLCEFNVLEQALNVSQTAIIREAAGKGRAPAIHAWIYDVHDGLLKDLKFQNIISFSRNLIL
jgi:carbonic anhydrase